MKTLTPVRTTTLTHFQVQAVKLMLEGHDFKAVGLQVNKDQSTIRKWSTIPDFVEMLKVGKYAAFQEAGIRLASTSFLAACVLEEVMTNPETKDESRIKAATAILDYATKLSQNLDLEMRIQLLEKAAKVEVAEDD